MKAKLITAIIAMMLTCNGTVEIKADDAYKDSTRWVLAQRGVNVREQPVDGEIVCALPMGTEINTLGTVVVMDEEEHPLWYEIEHNGDTYYVCVDYCTDDPDEIPKYTQYELDELARLISAEVGNYSKERQLAAGSVVLNRVKHHAYPNTIHDVIFQRGQYACTVDGHFYRKPTKMAVESAKQLLEYGSTLPSDVVFQSEFRQGSSTYAIMGNTFFCRW